MKVAISTDGENVSAHFGRCPSFVVLKIENGSVVSQSSIPNPGHHAGYLPRFLQENGIDVIVTGGMGRRAAALFADAGIEVMMGVCGRVDEAGRALAAGTLEGGERLCTPGSGKGYGVDKTECDHPDGNGHHH